MELPLPINLIDKLITRKDKKRILMAERFPAIVGKYKDKDTAYGKKAGLQPFDQILAVNGESVQFR